MENYIQATVASIIGTIFILGHKTFTNFIIKTHKKNLKAIGKPREINRYVVILTKSVIILIGFGVLAIGVLGFYYGYS